MAEISELFEKLDKIKKGHEEIRRGFEEIRRAMAFAKVELQKQGQPGIEGLKLVKGGKKTR